MRAWARKRWLRSRCRPCKGKKEKKPRWRRMRAALPRSGPALGGKGFSQCLKGEERRDPRGPGFNIGAKRGGRRGRWSPPIGKKKGGAPTESVHPGAPRGKRRGDWLREERSRGESKVCSRRSMRSSWRVTGGGKGKGEDPYDVP